MSHSIKGYTKEHREHDGGRSMQVKSRGRIKKRAYEGALVQKDCKNPRCFEPVITPEKCGAYCGRCTINMAIQQQKQEDEREQTRHRGKILRGRRPRKGSRKR